MFHNHYSGEVPTRILFHDDISICHSTNRHTRSYDDIQPSVVLIHHRVVFLITEMVSESFVRRCRPAPCISNYFIGEEVFLCLDVSSEPYTYSGSPCFTIILRHFGLECFLIFCKFFLNFYTNSLFFDSDFLYFSLNTLFCNSL